MVEKVSPSETEMMAAAPPKVSKGDAGHSHSFVRLPQWKKDGIKFMDGAAVQLMLGVLLIVSLFLPDAWVLGDAPDSSNTALDVILILIFAVFAMESIVLTICNPDYFNSFFFWCDVVGTLSILLDIELFTSLYSGGNESANQSGALLRAARAAKVGARYGRLMRLLKFIKFMDYLPCFNKGDEEVVEPSLSAARKVSNKLSNVLSRRVAGLVLLLVIVVPLLSYDMYYGATLNNESFGAFAKAIQQVGDDTQSTGECSDVVFVALMHQFSSFHSNEDKRLVNVKVWCADGYDTEIDFLDKDDFRANNMGVFSKESDITKVSGVLEKTVVSQFSAMFNILLIILVIIVLVGFSASFQSAIDIMVVVPLEKMMQTLRDSAGAILKSVQAMDDNEEADVLGDEEFDDDELETALLEKMIEKLARIAKHLMPSTTNIVEAGDNVDKATASWLNSNYSKNMGEVSSSTSGGVVIDKTLQTLKSGVDVSAVNSWQFDVLKYSYQQLFEVNQYIFSVMGFFNDFAIPVPVFEAFILEMSKQYKEKNTYHNFYHACDVSHTVFRLIMVSELHKVLSPLEIFSTVVAAIGHDVGHPGVNNGFLVKSKDKLAMIHNDRSPLENMHCSLLYEIMMDPNKNIFCGLTEGQWRESRKSITSSILGTDMMHHFDQISRVQIFLEVNGEDMKNFLTGKSSDVPSLKDVNQRLFIMELFLHCADISNPYKPFEICKAWADVVVEEFFSQGDREKREGLDVSPMMDRDTTNMYNMQMGFIEFVVAPLVNGFISVFPPLYEAGEFMQGNMISWAELRKGEIMADAKITDKDGECVKLDDRIDKFKDKMSFIATLKEFEANRGAAKQ